MSRKKSITLQLVIKNSNLRNSNKFIISLIKNRTIDMQDFNQEIQPFPSITVPRKNVESKSHRMDKKYPRRLNLNH